MGEATDELIDGLTEESADEAGEASPRELRPSRSSRKREALALQRLGVALTRLTTTQLAKLTLPEELLEAVMEARRLRSRAALARQRQYIGRIMRQTDAAPIEQALQALNAKLTG
jgi:ribosome-associated protein